MGVCVNCGGALEDRWKFCIFCGTPVQQAPISEPAAEAAEERAVEPDAAVPDEEAEPDAGAGLEPDFSGEPTAEPNVEQVVESDVEPLAEPVAEPEPARPPIPSAIRTFVPVDIPNEEEDDPTARQIRPRLRSRRVDVPLLLGIALGIAGVALIVYMVAVLSGQG